MESHESVFCPHSKENVSRPTYRRHQLIVANRKCKRKHATKEERCDDSESSDSDSDAVVSPAGGSGRLIVD